MNVASKPVTSQTYFWCEASMAPLTLMFECVRVGAIEGRGENCYCLYVFNGVKYKRLTSELHVMNRFHASILELHVWEICGKN